jgi:hypothetical protein
MLPKSGFGECPYEHIPDGLTDPRKELMKNLSPGKLLRKIKKHKKEQEKTSKHEETGKDKN